MPRQEVATAATDEMAYGEPTGSFRSLVVELQRDDPVAKELRRQHSTHQGETVPGGGTGWKRRQNDQGPDGTSVMKVSFTGIISYISP